jgi:hypothetical protein
VNVEPAPPHLTVAVLDSSVLVPNWSRITLQRIAARLAPPYAPVWSEWIIAETWRILTQRWLERFGRTSVDGDHRLRSMANEMLRHLLPVVRLYSLRGYAGLDPWPELTDVDDTPIWRTAVVARAQYVVSHNSRHFPPLVSGRHVYQGVEYLTAIEFIEDVLGLDAEAVYQRPLPAGAHVRSRRSRQ